MMIQSSRTTRIRQNNHSHDVTAQFFPHTANLPSLIATGGSHTNNMIAAAVQQHWLALMLTSCRSMHRMQLVDEGRGQVGTRFSFCGLVAGAPGTRNTIWHSTHQTVHAHAVQALECVQPALASTVV
jgi:hypothetical protein